MQNRILLKSHELFMRYGVRNVSMDEIAAHLGISKKTIYQFYEDKDALVEDVVELEIKRSIDQCAVAKHSCDNAVHEVIIAVEMMEEVFKVMNPSVVYELEKYHPKAYKKLSDYKAKFLYTIIKENLERGIKEDLYRDDINIEILAKYRLVSMFSIFNPELFNTKYNLLLVTKTITDNFLRGICSAKGLKLIQKYTSQTQKNLIHDKI